MAAGFAALLTRALAGTNRWVEPKHPFKFEASAIAPEYHRWIHNVSDFPPSKVRARARGQARE